MFNLPKAVAHLSKDPVLAQLITRFGQLNYQPDEDIFSSLVETIINQQLSGKAAATIFSRFKNLFPKGEFTPKLLSHMSSDQLRTCGVSGQKSGYLLDLAQKTLDGTLDLPHLTDRPNEVIIEHLTQVKGIGRWSAEMILMFSFHRSDVLPLDDLGIRRAFTKFYGVKDTNRAKMERIARAWQPFRTVACWYLWKGLDNR